MSYVLGDFGISKLGPGAHTAEEVAAAEAAAATTPPEAGILDPETGVWQAPTVTIHGTLPPTTTTPTTPPTTTPPATTPPTTTPPTTTRPWPGAGGTVMTRPCYPAQAVWGVSNVRAIPVNQPCPAGYSETQPPPASPYGGTATGVAGNTGGSTAGRTAGTPFGYRPTTTTGPVPSGTAVRRPTGSAFGTKPPQRVSIGAVAGAARPATQPTTPTTPTAPAETLPALPESFAAGAAPGEGFFAKYKWWLVGGSVVLVAAGVGAYFLLRKKEGPATAYIPIYEDEDEV